MCAFSKHSHTNERHTASADRLNRVNRHYNVCTSFLSTNSNQNTCSKVYTTNRREEHLVQSVQSNYKVRIACGQGVSWSWNEQSNSVLLLLPASSSRMSSSACTEASVPTTTTKKRWSKEEKRQRQEEKERSVQQQQQPKPKRTKKLITFPERLIKCATNAAAFTESVVFLKQGTDDKNVSVITSSDLSPLSPPTSINNSTVIAVKPLLILDLNGILCHRIRHCNNTIHPTRPYRPASDYNIANTPVIERPDIGTFLGYLDTHFCLAVWTSAKPKTAKKLIRLLFPNLPLRSRLLFVWTQNQCQSVVQRHDDDDNIMYFNDSGDVKPIFVKSLTQVWDQYPLWNPSNTLLIDDSPEKCPDIDNTLHPPPLHGKEDGVVKGDNNNDKGVVVVETNNDVMTPFVSDEDNGARQYEFFSHVANDYFGTPRETWPSQTTNELRQFLNDTATSHMGWRGKCNVE